VLDMVLHVNNSDYVGWEDIRVTRSMEQVAGSFKLQSTDQKDIKSGDACRVSIGDTTIIKGFVDDRAVEYDSESHQISISGRDATADLVDCTAIPVQIKGNTILQIAQTLCKPFPFVTVSSHTDVGAPFLNINAEVGQSPFEVLSMLAAHRGLILMSDGAGGLLITKPSETRAGGALVYGKNILSCRASSSMRDRYKNYSMVYQSQESSFNFGGNAQQMIAKSTDPGVTRYRPFSIYANDATDLQKHADFERNIRAGKSNRLTYTVSGWHSDGKNLWAPNTVVSVTDPKQAPQLLNTELLIASVTYVENSEGRKTELTVLPKSAFDVLATPEKANTGWVL